MLHLLRRFNNWGSVLAMHRERKTFLLLFGSSTVDVFNLIWTDPLSSVKAKYKLSTISSNIFTIIKMIKQKQTWSGRKRISFFKCFYLFLSNEFVDGKNSINIDSLSLKTLFSVTKAKFLAKYFCSPRNVVEIKGKWKEKS